MPTMRHWLPIPALILIALVLPSGASAQEDGVFVDPEGPAGKEYAIPLDQARRQGSARGGAGRGGVEPGAPGSAPLFGEGVSRAGTRGRSRGGDSGGSGGEDGRDGRSGGRGGEAGGDARFPTAAALDTEGSGASAGVVTGGVALAVVLIGLLLGLALRRTVGRRST